MSRIDSFFKKLEQVNSLLSVLDQFIDVDRLIAISNAQGPQAKLIKAILELSEGDPKIAQLQATLPVVQKLPVKGSKQKKLPQKT